MPFQKGNKLGLKGRPKGSKNKATDVNKFQLQQMLFNVEEMKRDFQLLTNQRNQQKREVCRSCYQTGTRGIVYGIPFYYHGDKNWDASYPTKGKKAEKGCVGCGWYDLERWRKDLIQKISS